MTIKRHINFFSVKPKYDARIDFSPEMLDVEKNNILSWNFDWPMLSR